MYKIQLRNKLLSKSTIFLVERKKEENFVQFLSRDGFELMSHSVSMGGLLTPRFLSRLLKYCFNISGENMAGGGLND